MMSAVSQHAIAQSIAEDALTLAQWVLENQGLGDSRLKEELNYAITASDNVMIELLFNDYITYIEHGHSPRSKIPPLSAIRDWALRKNIPPNNNTLYAIAKAIAQDSIAPRPILDLLIAELEKTFENEWSVDIFNYIVEQIQDLFEG